MAQLKKVVDPFGEVNVYPAAGGKVRVVATILMEPHKEGAQTGIALDGSGSMHKLYGVDDGGGILSSIFGHKQLHNEITPVAQQVCAYLARKIDADGGTTCIYWAVGPGGSQVEVIGDLRAEEAEKHIFGPPRDFGTGTQLLPAVRYFVERFRDAPWGFYVFITDGELHDLDAVKEYSTRLAREIAAGRRPPLKFVLIGVGSEVNEGQMEELDDLDTGTPIDLWDHKLAAEMRVLQEIFAEVVDKNARVADHGKILDPQGRVVKNYSDTGLPAYLEFEMPVGSDYFTLEVAGNRIHQALFDQARVPPPEMAGAKPPPSSRPSPASSPIPESKAIPPSPPAPASRSQPQEENKEDEDWKNLELTELTEAPDIDLRPEEGKQP
ncbi:MAG: VWA domain-containing protein [Planctomycetes bacterium]|nr:VWA domain-containing protein [Planctomycetota bacterium]